MDAVVRDRVSVLPLSRMAGTPPGALVQGWSGLLSRTRQESAAGAYPDVDAVVFRSADDVLAVGD